MFPAVDWGTFASQIMHAGVGYVLFRWLVACGFCVLIDPQTPRIMLLTSMAARTQHFKTTVAPTSVG